MLGPARTAERFPRREPERSGGNAGSSPRLLQPVLRVLCLGLYLCPNLP